MLGMHHYPPDESVMFDIQVWISRHDTTSRFRDLIPALSAFDRQLFAIYEHPRHADHNLCFPELITCDPQFRFQSEQMKFETRPPWRPCSHNAPNLNYYSHSYSYSYHYPLPLHLSDNWWHCFKYGNATSQPAPLLRPYMVDYRPAMTVVIAGTAYVSDDATTTATGAAGVRSRSDMGRCEWSVDSGLWKDEDMKM